MKINTINRKIGFFAVFALVAIGFSVGESYGAAFLKIKGIEGESQDKGHEDWINIDSVSFSPDDSANMIHLIKKLDYSSAGISQSTISGKIHERVVLDICNERETQDCKRYDLVNVSFTNYLISANSDERPTEEISFVYQKVVDSTGSQAEPIQESGDSTKMGEIPATEIIQAKVPSWVQTTASFWVNGDVSDREFTDGIGFLVRENIINIEENVESSGEDSSEPSVPSWIRDSTKWWIDGQVPEDQFLESIKWLIKNNIIRGF